VTGASRGLGRAVALELARAGAAVVAGARNTAQLDQLAEVARGEGLTLHPHTLDVTDAASVEAFAARAVELAGPPNIVVNNAGWALFREADRLDIADFDRMIAINLRGPWLVARAAIAPMRRIGGGRIINVGSIAGRVPFARGTGYCAAKAGLHALSEALMLELRADGIAVTVVAPGSIDTGFHREALPAAHAADQSWMLDPTVLAREIRRLTELPADVLPNYYEIRPLNPPRR
jgi:NAD(P)-dependent dehydrogenase (short-subunit alcohol dehydrogenase family)